MSSDRETWGKKAEFILSSMGYTIGLGNVWRFPYMCYANGGGSFLIPYLLMLFLRCLPVMFLEASLGQFTSRGCVSCWSVVPLFKGIGIAMMIVTTYFCLYYNLLITYILYYMYWSFLNPLPWVGCNHPWNTEHCYESFDRLSHHGNTTDGNTTDIMTTDMAMTTAVSYVTGNMTDGNTTETRVRASEEFWKHKVLQVSDGLHDMGAINWQLLLCFIAAWVIVYCCVIKGVKSSGKVVYFTATFPYLVLFILLIRGATLPGAADGILFFIYPEWKKLLSAKVWKAAANQVFFSFSAGWGGFLTLASYNKFRNNVYRDMMIIAISGGLTSIFSGFVIFSVIGFMAWDSNLPVEKVVASGPGLAFIAYPEAVSRLPVPQLWAFLFFFMLLTLGLDSQFVAMEVVLTATVDEVEVHYPFVRKYKHWFTLGACVFLFLIGLPLVTQGGLYVMTLLDWYSGGFTPMIVAFIEMLAISYAYGSTRFMQDVNAMIGYTPIAFWRYCWMAITPLIVTFIFVFSFVDYEAATVGEYTFPPWGEAIGWLFTVTSLAAVLVYAIIHLYMSHGTVMERLRHSLEPSYQWGPARNEDRITAGYAKLPEHHHRHDYMNDEHGMDTGRDDFKMGYTGLTTNEKERDCV
ncbi:sodium- and chloride-dependent glycine transporter 2-like [Amphiura filiformis]|uniref:sodium- and chloride-dependent glycine transporter 2-like n=1 Tax=Amphiura filiformis TaxID=82378 RepID=UPI003B224934